jgi:cobalt/nickel transport system ATP-binding protein
VNSLIEVKNVTCRVNSRPVIQGLSFKLDNGQKLALLGANGSGKSTLINALLGFLPYEGSIRINGLELRDNIDEIRRIAGAMFSCIDDQLLLPTVFEEVRFSLSNTFLSENEKDTKTSEALADLHLSHLAKRPPFELSSGEKQKAVLATLLMSDPRLLIMDEPTKEIDTRSKISLAARLQRLQQSMILSTHDYEFVRTVCTCALVLNDKAGRYFSSMSFSYDQCLMEEMQLL